MMNNITKEVDLNETDLALINGGNRAGDAVLSGMGWAAGGVKVGSKLGPWGALVGGVGGAAIGGYLGYNA